MINLTPLLKDLCNSFGPPGFEEEIRGKIRDLATPMADEITETVLGNLIVTREGEDPTKTLLIDAHLDEVGFIVTFVEPDGFLRFAPLGGVDPRVAPSQRVLVRSRDGSKRVGAIGVFPPHVTKDKDRSHVFQLDELFIDLGCSSAEAVEALGIGVGAPVVFATEFAEMEEGCILSKALDDRAGCALAIGLLDSLRETKPPVNVVVSFTVQEETGGLGAHTASHGVAPQVALVLEGTTAVDTPDVPARKTVCALRKGPVITVADAKTIVPEKMVRFLEEQASGAGIPCQLKTPGIGGTDGRLIQHSGDGVLTGILSVPCRYIHSSGSILNLEDLKHSMMLVNRFVENCADLWG